MQFSKHLLLPLVLLLSACGGGGEPRLPALQTGDIILAFGDSLTVGVGATAQQSYPAVLADLTGLKVVGSGVSGETTDRGLQRLPKVLSGTRPRLMILMEGGNDILRNRSKAAVRDNLAAMIEMAQAQGTAVVLIGVPEKKLFSNTAPIYDELAAQFDLVYAPDLLAGLLRSPSLKSDPIHLNAKGYRKLAEGIEALLRDAGALP